MAVHPLLVITTELGGYVRHELSHRGLYLPTPCEVRGGGGWQTTDWSLPASCTLCPRKTPTSITQFWAHVLEGAMCIWVLSPCPLGFQVSKALRCSASSRAASNSSGFRKAYRRQDTRPKDSRIIRPPDPQAPAQVWRMLAEVVRLHLEDEDASRERFVYEQQEAFNANHQQEQQRIELEEIAGSLRNELTMQAEQHLNHYVQQEQVYFASHLRNVESHLQAEVANTRFRLQQEYLARTTEAEARAAASENAYAQVHR